MAKKKSSSKNANQKASKQAKPAQKSAANKSGSAAKRQAQNPKAGSKGITPAPKAKRVSASTPQRSQNSKSNGAVNAQSERATRQVEVKAEQKQKAKPNLGKILRGKTKYIDVEPKEERNYVVVVDNGKTICVSKLKSIKIFDENDKNADKALVEINATRYGLEKRTGVDFQVFSKNRMSGKPLNIDDKEVFPEDKERGTLGSHDLNRVLVHTGRALRGKKKRGK